MMMMFKSFRSLDVSDLMCFSHVTHSDFDTRMKLWTPVDQLTLENHRHTSDLILIVLDIWFNVNTSVDQINNHKSSKVCLNV